jgi:hypothetical protein
VLVCRHRLNLKGAELLIGLGIVALVLEELENRLAAAIENINRLGVPGVLRDLYWGAGTNLLGRGWVEGHPRPWNRRQAILRLAEG